MSIVGYATVEHRFLFFCLGCKQYSNRGIYQYFKTGSLCFIIAAGDSFQVVSVFSRFPCNSLFGIQIAHTRAWKPFCGGDKSCISQLIAIYSPQATRSKRQTLWYFLELCCCHRLISVWKLYTAKFNYDVFIFKRGMINFNCKTPPTGISVVFWIVYCCSAGIAVGPAVN